jgi:hypothetical protein
MATPEVKAPAAPAGKRVEVTLKKATGPGDDKVHTWPHLVRGEFLCAIIVTLFLLVWALLVDAPLEEPANPRARRTRRRRRGTSSASRRCSSSSTPGTRASCCRASSSWG